MSDYHQHVKRLPPHMQRHILAYIERGEPIGDFLTALFSNKLVQTFAAADWVNVAAIPQYVDFVWNAMPSSSHGSPEKVAEWQRRGGLEGMEREAEALASQEKR